MAPSTARDVKAVPSSVPPASAHIVDARIKDDFASAPTLRTDRRRRLFEDLQVRRDVPTTPHEHGSTFRDPELEIVGTVAFDVRDVRHARDASGTPIGGRAQILRLGEARTDRVRVGRCRNQQHSRKGRRPTPQEPHTMNEALHRSPLYPFHVTERGG